MKEKDAEYNTAIQTLVDEVRVKASVEAKKKVRSWGSKISFVI